MTAWTIISRIRAGRRALDERLPAPMAAPETLHLRHMRLTLIGELCLLAVLTAAWPFVATTCLRALGAFVWLALALSALAIGVRWLAAKVRADNAWAKQGFGSPEHGE